MSAKTKALSRNDLETFCSKVTDRLNGDIHGTISILKGNVCKEIHMAENEQRMKVLDAMAQESVLSVMIPKFCTLVKDCYKGRFGDRYANLQVTWRSWITNFIIPDSPEYNLVMSFLDKDIPRADLSAAVHSFATSFFTHAHEIIMEFKPKPETIHTKYPMDKKESLLAFGGACMGLVQRAERKASGTDMMIKLIKNLQMTKVQRDQYIEWGILDVHHLGSLHIIPVPALLPYLTLLNSSIQKCCHEERLSLHGKDFIQVNETRFLISKYWTCYLQNVLR